MAGEIGKFVTYPLAGRYVLSSVLREKPLVTDSSIRVEGQKEKEMLCSKDAVQKELYVVTCRGIAVQVDAAR